MNDKHLPFKPHLINGSPNDVPEIFGRFRLGDDYSKSSAILFLKVRQVITFQVLDAFTCIWRWCSACYDFFNSSSHACFSAVHFPM